MLARDTEVLLTYEGKWLDKKKKSRGNSGCQETLQWHVQDLPGQEPQVQTEQEIVANPISCAMPASASSLLFPPVLMSSVHEEHHPWQAPVIWMMTYS